MSELYRPHGEELLFSTRKELPAKIKEHYTQEGVEDLRDVLPQDLCEAVEDAQATVELEMQEVFGQDSIPQDVHAEMTFVLKAIKSSSLESRYQESANEGVLQQLEYLAVKMAHYKEMPREIQVEMIPEVGLQYTYKNARGQKVEHTADREMEDMIFNLESWAGMMVDQQNAVTFQKSIEKARGSVGHKPEAEQATAFKKEMYKYYEVYGFSREQIDNLIILADDGTLTDLEPEGTMGGLRKLEIMKEVWNQYLSQEEKSTYIKLALQMTVLGATEAAGPYLIGKSMDTSSVTTGLLFAGGYLGFGVAEGWVRKALNVRFEEFLNELTQKQGGLLEKLSRDLVFQPGEKMGNNKERGRIISASRRSQSAFREIISSTAQVTAPAIAGVTVGLGAMMSMDWRLGALTLASAPIALAISKRVQGRLGKIVDETYKNEAAIAEEVEEQLSAHQEIILSGMQLQMAQRMEEFGVKANALGLKKAQTHALWEFQSGYVLNSAVVAGLTAAGVALRNSGVAQTGKILSALMYSGMFRRNFEQIVRTDTRLLESITAIVEMEEVFNGYAKEEELADQKRVPVSGLEGFSLNLKDVTLEFDDEKIIDGVTFQVPAGAVVRLHGKSGYGKTTLTKLISGYYKPTSGQIEIGGAEVNTIKKTGPESLYSRVAYLSQAPYIFDVGNLRENLAFGNENVDDTAMKRVLEELELSERFSKFGQIDLESKVVGLSGGQKARLGLARVLLKIRSQENGGLVILDQATEDLDIETEAEVAKILVQTKREKPDTTFVIISHRSDFIRALEHPVDGGEGITIQTVKIHKGKVQE